MREIKSPVMGLQMTDAEGRLTADGVELLQRLVEALREQQTTTADHEARIEALEP